MRFHLAGDTLDSKFYTSDKFYHFVGGALICAVIYFICQRLLSMTLLTMMPAPDASGWAKSAGLYGSIILIVLYDLVQGFKKEGFSFWDVLCGGLGALAMWIIIL